jgi:hypothetical protein
VHRLVDRGLLDLEVPASTALIADGYHARVDGATKGGSTEGRLFTEGVPTVNSA